MIETGQGAEVFLGDFGSVLRESETIGIGGISDNQTATGRLSDVVESSSLFFEDFSVDLQELFPFHSFFSREASYENTNVNVLKDVLGIRAHYDSFEQWICTIVELHLDSF